MENLDKSQFIVLLETSLNRRLLSPEQKTLDAAYEDYIDLLHGLTVQSCKSSLDLLHELARLQSCLMRLQERIVEKESPQVLLLKSALLLTNFEIRLVFTRVRIRPSPPRCRSKSPSRRCSSPSNSHLRISWSLLRPCNSPEPYAASTAHGSIWRHLSMCFPELSTSVSTTRSSAAIRSSTESCV